MVMFKMRDSLSSVRYSPICNVLRQWKTLLIPIYYISTTINSLYLMFLHLTLTGQRDLHPVHLTVSYKLDTHTHTHKLDCILYTWLYPIHLTASYTLDCILYTWLHPIHLTVSYTLDCILYTWLYPIHLTASYTLDCILYTWLYPDGDVVYSLTLGTHADSEAYSSCRVRVYVCVYVWPLITAASHIGITKQRYQCVHSNTAIVLNFADFSKNASFKSYGVICLPREAPAS